MLSARKHRYNGKGRKVGNEMVIIILLALTYGSVGMTAPWWIWLFASVHDGASPATKLYQRTIVYNRLRKIRKRVEAQDKYNRERQLHGR